MQAKPDQDDFPWWLLVLCALGLLGLFQIWTSDAYAQILSKLAKGIGITILVTCVGFLAAAILGLLLAVGSSSRFIAIRQFVRLYIEVIRGVPIIVLLLYVAFAGVPATVWLWNWVGLPELQARDVSLLWRAVIALVIAYAAFLAEVFRAGLAAVDRGQIEAAEALGLGPWLRFRLIIFPQAFRTILPPLGNDLVAMVKDSSLVSVLGVADVTQLAKITAAGNFQYFETYNIAGPIYLALSVGLSLILRHIEKRLRHHL